MGIDKETDLAILQINIDYLPVATIGNSNFLKVGDIDFAIGKPVRLWLNHCPRDSECNQAKSIGNFRDRRLHSN